MISEEKGHVKQIPIKELINSLFCTVFKKKKKLSCSEEAGVASVFSVASFFISSGLAYDAQATH